MIEIIYVTCRDHEEARMIAHKLIVAKLAACANILPNMESLYLWEGKIEQAREVVLIVKTTKSNVHACISIIETSHSYKTPCALSLSINTGSSKFIQWIEDQTTGSTP